ncbi:MAG: hypothetical protein H6905_05145 [Hyphomicrobiales bacterium]|nr:hypothetical protein [Hyphomicrobiales bacterium]
MVGNRPWGIAAVLLTALLLGACAVTDRMATGTHGPALAIISCDLPRLKNCGLSQAFGLHPRDRTTLIDERY